MTNEPPSPLPPPVTPQTWRLADKVSGVLQQMPTTKTSTAAARMTIERDTNEHAKNATRLHRRLSPGRVGGGDIPTHPCAQTLLIRRVGRATKYLYNNAAQVTTRR